MNYTILFIFFSAVLAIVYGIVLIKMILQLSPGNEKMKEIARAIQDGAKAYLNRQYKTITLPAQLLIQ